jgi:hypothetical protein
MVAADFSGSLVTSARLFYVITNNITIYVAEVLSEIPINASVGRESKWEPPEYEPHINLLGCLVLLLLLIFSVSVHPVSVVLITVLFVYTV